MNLHQHYKSDSVATASPARLITMLFDRALQGIAVARHALTPGPTADRELAHRELVHTQKVISELQVSLDMDRGGEIAANLWAIYDWCLRELVEANLHKDLGRLDSIERIVRDLRDAWTTATAELQG